MSSVFEKFLLALSQLLKSIFKSLFNIFKDILMLSRFLSSAEWWTLQCFIATLRPLMYSRKSKGLTTDPCGTPHVILEVLDAKPFIDTNWLRFAKYDSNHPQYQKPSEGQQKYHLQ